MGKASAQASAQVNAQAQVPPRETAEPAEGEILVIAERSHGQVDAPQPPLLELGTEEIAAYGASSIADLLAALGPQTSSGRGRGGGSPVILVNGTRLSSFRELRSYPPEAIEKVEVFPEEVAQRYGYSADRRVVNFILKPNYESRAIELEYGQPWEGGTSTKETEATYLRITGPSRLNINLGWNDTSLLSEAERAMRAADLPAGQPDPAPYRSLVSDSAGLEATANWTTRLADNGTSLSLNATFERDDSLRLQGLSPLSTSDPLEVVTRGDTYAFGSTLNAPIGRWQATATVDASRTYSRSLIDQRNAIGYDQAESTTDSASGKVTAAGRLLYLPAGEVSVTLDGGYDWTRITSEDTRRAADRTRQTRGDLNAGINVSVPITSVRDDVLSAVGDISLNATAGVDYLSDFGTLTDWSIGLTWAPTETLSVNGSFIARDTAPSLGQLGNPEIPTYNVQFYDLTRGESVEVTLLTGGNPELPMQSQSDWKIGLNWELPFLERSNISVDYYKNHSEDVAEAFPQLTPTIESMYPGRVTRDANGRLVQIDQRPVTFAEQNSERVQVGLNLSGPFGAARPGVGAGFAGGQGAAGAGGRPTGAARGNFDPARFQAMRERLCVRVPDGTPAALEITPELVAEMPEPMQQRLRGPGGQIDPSAFAQLRERLCSQDGPPSGTRQAAEGRPLGGQSAGAPPASGGRSGDGLRPGGFGGRGGDGRGRWFLNLNYTYEISNEVLVGLVGPLLDLLEGDALSGGGRPRHAASLRGGLFYRGVGTQIAGAYTGTSRVDGAGSNDLFFNDYVTFEARVFADLGQQASLIEQVPLLANTRISFSIKNIFDARQRVTDKTGEVPYRYQQYLIDPVGRLFEVELRKLF